MNRALPILPWTVAIGAIIAITLWLTAPPRFDLLLRNPGYDGRKGPEPLTSALGNPVLRGRVVPGTAKPANLQGEWPRFRGVDFTALAATPARLAREWSDQGPRKLWTLDVGEGYAGAAVWRGRAFVMDYDREKKEEALRCVSLADGQEIWRYAYPNSIKRDHGVTRTVPSVDSNSVVAIGPKCHVLSVETESGKLRWSLDLVKEFGTTVPPWYTGQCPLVDGNRVILAPAGPETLLVAVDATTGQVIWRTPNPRGFKMSHSSIVPIEIEGKRLYVYCASGGVVAVSAKDGAIVWDTTEWKIGLATVPAPVDLGGGRIFLTGGYNAGSTLIQLKEANGRFTSQTLWRVKADVFGATQHSPIFFQDHLFGIRADGRFVCLSTEGKVVWTSEPGSNLGLGAFMIADGVIFALNDSGVLHLIEATPAAYRPLAKARVLEGPEAWGPLALADGRLIARDLYKMICLDVAQP